jgi:hypothetical protein
MRAHCASKQHVEKCSRRGSENGVCGMSDIPVISMRENGKVITISTVKRSNADLSDKREFGLQTLCSSGLCPSGMVRGVL